MSLDRKYRPSKFKDVLGQEGTRKILKQIIKTRKGFQSSYIFGGHYGIGKTTLGRILARALLCDQPLDGEPCDECSSCRTILETGCSDSFEEVDAATNSGKDYIKKILEEINYTTFSGKKKIWLFDEAHQLSRDALDGLLKPMEEFVPGTDDRRLICIFCTTEPEKMRSTISSRSLFFQVRPVVTKLVYTHLKSICEQEKIIYEDAALKKIADLKGEHIRDSLKTLEVISLLGDVNVENLNHYLCLDKYILFENIMTSLVQSNNRRVYLDIQKACISFPPKEIYRHLSRLCMHSWELGNSLTLNQGVWSKEVLNLLFKTFRDNLIRLAYNLSNVPKNVSQEQLLLDILSLKDYLKNILSDEPGSVSELTPAEGTKPSCLETKEPFRFNEPLSLNEFSDKIKKDYG